MKELLKPLAQFVTHESGYGVIFFILIILSVAMVNMLLFHRRIIPIIQEIKKVVLLIGGYESEEIFCENFEEIDNYLNKSPILGSFWNEFVGTFIFPDPGKSSGQSVIQGTVDSEYFFNDENILKNRVNIRFYNHVPNYLIGLGILGTFIGLVAGIFLSAPHLQSQDINVTKQALRSLLEGASLAFWTSIVGILLSIVFSVVEKRYMYIYQGLVHKWNVLLDERLDQITPEYLASKQLVQAEEQTLQLKKFNTDFAVTLGDTIGEKIGEVLVGGDIPRKVGDSVKEIVGEQLEHFGQSLNELTEQLSVTVEELKDGYQEMVNNTERLHKGFRDVMTDASQAMTNVRGGMNEFETSVENMKISAEFIREMKISLGGVVDTFSSSAKNLGQMGESFSTATQSMSASIEGLGELASNLRGIVLGFNKMDESAESFFVKVDEGLKVFITSVQDFVGQLETGLSNVAKELTAVAVEFREAIEESTEEAATGEAEERVEE